VAIQTGGSLLEGTFDTLDETGCLIVSTADGRRMPVAAGDIYFGSAASVRAV
jgi:BirA family biotin operon repressor/biotin-[acetyl-CoA-carboxylase] ligase